MGKSKKSKYFHKKNVILRLASLLMAMGLFVLGALPSYAAFNSLMRDIPGLSGVSDIILMESLDDGSVIFNVNDAVRTAPASDRKSVV